MSKLKNNVFSLLVDESDEAFLKKRQQAAQPAAAPAKPAQPAADKPKETKPAAPKANADKPAPKQNAGGDKQGKPRGDRPPRDGNKGAPRSQAPNNRPPRQPRETTGAGAAEGTDAVVEGKPDNRRRDSHRPREARAKDGNNLGPRKRDRPYDRKSGTGRPLNENKKGGAGKHNWGANKPTELKKEAEDVTKATETEETEKVENKTEETTEATETTQDAAKTETEKKEEGPKELDLKEWQAQQQKAKKALKKINKAKSAKARETEAADVEEAGFEVKREDNEENVLLVKKDEKKDDKKEKKDQPKKQQTQVDASKVVPIAFGAKPRERSSRKNDYQRKDKRDHKPKVAAPKVDDSSFPPLNPTATTAK